MGVFRHADHNWKEAYVGGTVKMGQRVGCIAETMVSIVKSTCGGRY